MQIKKTTLILAIILSLFIFLPPQATQASDYTLDYGDVLSISVWGFDEFKELQPKEILIRPDGKISFPLAGEIDATGQTAAMLTETIATRLSTYIKNPQVSVNVLKFRTTRVYVLGKVNKPGLYEIEKQHNLLDAIGMAEGYTSDAAKKKVHIIKKASPNKEVLRANLLDLLEKGDMTQNYALADGDVVYLSDNGAINFARDVLPFLSAAYQVNEIKKK